MAHPAKCPSSTFIFPIVSSCCLTHRSLHFCTLVSGVQSGSHLQRRSIPSLRSEPVRKFPQSPPSGIQPIHFVVCRTQQLRPPLRLYPLSSFTVMASSVAQKRLFHEYKNLSTNPPEGITAGPVSEDDMFYWEALIEGPGGTPFEGGVFAAELKFPKDYPLSPPTMKFVGGGVWHPNGRPKPQNTPSLTAHFNSFQ